MNALLLSRRLFDEFAHSFSFENFFEGRRRGLFHPLSYSLPRVGLLALFSPPRFFYAGIFAKCTLQQHAL
jgi:hypothetical protein